MTIVASAISPMAMASPASENRLMVWPNAASGSAVNSVPSSSTQIGATAARTFLSATRDHEDDDDQLVDDAPGRSSSACPRSAPSGRRSGRSRCPSGSDGLSCSSFCSQRAGDGQDVPALLHDGDAADDFAGAVEIGDAAAQVVARPAGSRRPSAAPAAPARSRPRTRNSSLSRLVGVERRRAADTRGW